MAAEFEGLVALVTGGASGIGAAVATVLTKLGAQVAALDREPGACAHEVLQVHADVTDDASVQQAIAGLTGRFGRLDIVVNNAGIGAQGTVADNDDDLVKDPS